MELTPFCACADGRYVISAPWVKDGIRYATDGKLLVAVPAAGEDDTPLAVGKQFFDGAKLMSSQHVGICNSPIPRPTGETLEEERTDCDCGDTCMTCDGSGECTCSACEDTHTCGECDGDGSLPDSHCEQCHGSGRITTLITEAHPVVIGPAMYNGNLILRILDLPGVLCSMPATDRSPLVFTADGDLWGLLAPVRPRSTEG
jgi:hypothetical protein